MIGSNTGVNFQMAVYDDNNGVPNNLIAETEFSTVGDGLVTLPVTPMNIYAGDYWIMAIYQATGYHSPFSATATGNVVYFKNVAYGSDLPANASDFSSYTGHDFLYFLEISCGLSTQIEELERVENIQIVPNPSQDFVSFKNSVENDEVIFFDVTGKKVMKATLKTQNEELDVTKLSEGIYFIQINNQAVHKFVKQ